jgi:hypothetical protein
MPGAVILACEMIEDEVRLALESVAPEARPPLVWMESGLHDRPERLKAALAELIGLLDRAARKGEAVMVPSVRPGRGPAADRREEVTIGPVDEVILALGYCGNALKGLGAEHLTLVFPRVDDCISLLLNHGCVREDIPRDPRSYYLTRGWFNHESSMTEAFEDWTERFGRERAEALRATMFAGYQQVKLIDTKAYEVEECIDKSRGVAEDLSLSHEVVAGSVQLLEKLFRGERGSEIVVIPPTETISFDHLFAAQCVEGGK